MKKIKALYVEPGRKPRVVSIKDDYEEMQKAVKGDIEYVRYFHDVILVVNEVGKLLKLKPNRCIFNSEGNLLDIIVGPFLIISTEEGKSLSDKMINKYKEVFARQEYFFADRDDPNAALLGGAIDLLDEYKLPRSNKTIFVKKMMPVFSFEIMHYKEEYEDLIFFPYSYLKKRNRHKDLIAKNFKTAYKGDLTLNETLDDIYERFNINRPFDYKHHSMSIGDVVVIKQGRNLDMRKAFFVDDIGFVELTNFFDNK